jgi:hypothetical protein
MGTYTGRGFYETQVCKDVGFHTLVRARLSQADTMSDKEWLLGMYNMKATKEIFKEI